MKHFILIAAALFMSTALLHSQELRCNVTVNSSKIEGSNKQVFKDMQKTIYEFMNNTAWTNHVYSMEERIECNMFININQQVSSDEFKGTLQIQSRRPVYKSSYNTVLLNFIDESVQFRYVEFDQLEFSLSSHSSNLTSILAYYAYIILGLDYDSFSMEGGTEFFEKAEKIVHNAQNAKESGWKAYETNKKNRYWLIENIMNRGYAPVRECYYRYNRLGLDRMTDKVDLGRGEIAESLKGLQEVYRQKPDPYLFYMKIFFDAKSDELVNIFKEAYNEEKNRVFTILSEVDAANSSKYQQIIKSGNK